MAGCKGMRVHICSGSRTLQGTMLGLKEMNLSMEIKMSDGGLDRTPQPIPDAVFLYSQLCQHRDLGQS